MPACPVELQSSWRKCSSPPLPTTLLSRAACPPTTRIPGRAAAVRGMFSWINKSSWLTSSLKCEANPMPKAMTVALGYHHQVPPSYLTALVIWSQGGFLNKVILYPSKIELDAYGEGGRSITQQRDLPSWDELPSQGPHPDFTSWSFHWLRPSDRTFVFMLNFLGTFTQCPLHHTSLHLFIYVFICLLISVIYILPEHCAWLFHTWMYFSFNFTTRSMIIEMPSAVTTPFTVWTYSRYSISACYISLCEIIPYTSAIMGGYGGGGGQLYISPKQVNV